MDKPAENYLLPWSPGRIIQNIVASMPRSEKRSPWVLGGRGSTSTMDPGSWRAIAAKGGHDVNDLSVPDLFEYLINLKKPGGISRLWLGDKPAYSGEALQSLLASARESELLHAMRARQAGQITNVGGLGVLGGVGIGLASVLPKYLESRRRLKEFPGAAESLDIEDLDGLEDIEDAELVDSLEELSKESHTK